MRSKPLGIMVTYKDRKELLLYIVFSLVAVLADLGIFYIFSEFERNYVLSAVLAFPLGVLTIYACVTYFNFKNVPGLQEILTSAFVCLFLDALLFYILLRLGVLLILSKSVAGIIALLCIYPMVKMLNFVCRLLSNKAIFKKPDILLILFVILLGLFAQLSYVRYPHCLNLCDPSIHLGMLMSDYYGNPPYEDPRLAGVYNVYPWLGMFALSSIVKLLNLNPVSAFVFAGWLTASVALVFACLAARKFGVSGISLLIFAFIESTISLTDGLKGVFGVFNQQSTHFLAFSLLAFSLAVYLKKRAFGLVLIAVSFMIFSQFHFLNTVFGLAVLFLFFGFQFFILRKRFLIFDFLISFAYGVVSLFPTIWAWYLNGFKILNPYISLRGQTVLLKEIHSFLFNNWFTSLLTVLLIIALMRYFAYFRENSIKRENFSDLTALAILLACIILGFNNLYLKPLLGFDIVPDRFLMVFFKYAAPLVICMSFTRTKFFRFVEKRRIFFFAGILIIMSLIAIQVVYSSPDIKHGLGWEEAWPFTVENTGNIIGFVLSSTNPSDTIAAPYALGSVISTLTGRKLVATHSEHTNIFADFDKRNADAALLLYSNNPQTIRNITDEYGVRYVILLGVSGGEYQTSPKYEQLFRDNQVSYYKTNFNYGKCYERGHCPPVEVIYAENRGVSQAFLSVFNDSTTVQHNGVPVYIFKKGAPSMNLVPKAGDIFFIHRSRRFWR